MHIFIKPQPITCLSFDLDDTLYDNRPIMRRAEQKLLDYLHEQFSATEQWYPNEIMAIKAQLLRTHAGLVHDVSHLRQAAIAQGLVNAGYSNNQAHKGAVEALQHFLHYRSDFTLSTSVMDLLEALKQKYPLIAITNGNVDAKRIGLDGMIEFALCPGNGMRMKPYGDMFHLALNTLNIDADRLMHIGDSSASDVRGAREAGCQAAWLNPAFGVQQHVGVAADELNATITTLEKTVMNKQSSLLPHICLSNLEQLRALL
ncbi:HAD-IA family hydrolase [Shewanella surugensis]|uniref:HAD-IA family hydrolase n=1 Tax=Shewanella surugensis TaxID=212020 RepID=A0ABT0LG63_9GAMM|nr:HAD-IA family hydrolase [Shewanella surugensis]MCL1126658.1 HAD-IA family hydrolase [Shewanella surugensis]